MADWTPPEAAAEEWLPPEAVKPSGSSVVTFKNRQPVDTLFQEDSSEPGSFGVRLGPQATMPTKSRLPAGRTKAEAGSLEAARAPHEDEFLPMQSTTAGERRSAAMKELNRRLSPQAAAGEVAAGLDMVAGLPSLGVKIFTRGFGQVVAELGAGVSHKAANMVADELAAEWSDSNVIAAQPFRRLMAFLGMGEAYDESHISKAMEWLMKHQEELLEKPIEEKTGGALTQSDVRWIVESAMFTLGTRGMQKVGEAPRPKKPETPTDLRTARPEDILAKFEEPEAPPTPEAAEPKPFKKEYPTLGKLKMVDEFGKPLAVAGAVGLAAYAATEDGGDSATLAALAAMPISRRLDRVSETLPMADPIRGMIDAARVGGPSALHHLDNARMELVARGAPRELLRELDTATRAMEAQQFGKTEIPSWVLPAYAATAVVNKKLDDYNRLRDSQKMLKDWKEDSRIPIEAGVGFISLAALTRMPEATPFKVLHEQTRYTTKFLDHVAKKYPGQWDFSVKQLRQELGKAGVAAEERAVFEQILGKRERITAKELIGETRVAVGDFELTPKVFEGTSHYAPYGLERIDRIAADEYGGYTVPEGVDVTEISKAPPARTTIYQSPLDLPPSPHFPDVPKYFAHTRSFEEGGVRHVVEVQSDLMQRLGKVLTPEEKAGLEAEIAQQQVSVSQAEGLKKALGRRASAAGWASALERYAETSHPEGRTAAEGQLGRSLVSRPGPKGVPLVDKVFDLADKGEYAEVYRLVLSLLRDESKTMATLDPRSQMWLVDAVSHVGERQLTVSSLKLSEMKAKLAGGEMAASVLPIARDWYKRLVREEVAEATRAREVAEQVTLKADLGPPIARFATADTVAKVEGWPEEYGEAVRSARNSVLILEEDIRRASGPNPRWWPVNEETLPQYLNRLETRLAEARQLLKELEANEAASKPNAPRFGKNQLLYDRYRNGVEKFLRSEYRARDYTDSAGHTWLEIDLPKEPPQIAVWGAAGAAVGAGLLAATTEDSDLFEAGLLTVPLIARRRIPREAYFTRPRVAAAFSDWVKSHSALQKASEFVEPAAGAGDIQKHFPNAKGYDIHPLHENVIKADFLKTKLGYVPGRVFVGNPPFGVRGAFAKKFLIKALEEGDYAAFIMPPGARGAAFADGVPGRLIAEAEFNSARLFYGPDGKPLDMVRAIAQIWERGETANEKLVHVPREEANVEAPRKMIGSRVMTTIPLKVTAEEAARIRDFDWVAATAFGGRKTGRYYFSDKEILNVMKGRHAKADVETIDVRGDWKTPAAVGAGVITGLLALQLDGGDESPLALAALAAVPAKGKAAKVLPAAAAIGAGAALTAYLSDPGNKALNAGLAAAVLGVAAYAKSSNPVIKRWAEGSGLAAEVVFGNLSSELRTMSEPLLRRMTNHERLLKIREHNALRQISPFSEAVVKLPDNLREALDMALMSSDRRTATKLIDSLGRPELSSALRATYAYIDNTGTELQRFNLVKKLGADHFPRIVTDLDGLMAKLGKGGSDYLGKKLGEANTQKLKRSGDPLNDIEMSRVVNEHLQAAINQSDLGGQSGILKKRSIAELRKELLPFYATAGDSIAIYARAASREIERARFFGKDLRQAKDTLAVNVDASIGALVKAERAAGNLSPEGLQRLESLLRSRFGPGERSGHYITQSYRNIVQALLLGNPFAAFVQFGDAAIAVAIHGVLPTIKGVGQAILDTANSKLGTTAKWRLEDFGLVDHITEDLVRGSREPYRIGGYEISSAKFLDKTLKWSGFSFVDEFSKLVNLNAAAAKFEKLARTEKGRAEIMRRYGEYFGGDSARLIEDLKVGRKSPLVGELIFRELSDLQPITKLEMSQGYLASPNTRPAYVLKSFMIKQMNLVRERGFREIAKGDAASVARGTEFLVRYSLALGMSGAGLTLITNWLLGKATDVELADVAENVFKTFGWSSYAIDKAKKEDVIVAAVGTVLPPFRLFGDILRTPGELRKWMDDNPKANPKGVSYFPVVGKLIYHRAFGGAEKADAREEKLKARKERERLKELMGD